MRDLALTALIFGGLPFALRHPYAGVFYWTWLGLMNPQRLAYGFAHDFPYSYVVAIVTLLGLVFTRDPKGIKGGALTKLLIAFMVWMSFTTLFALHPEPAHVLWLRVFKIQVMIWVAIMLLQTRKQLLFYVWIMVIALGYYGGKGGLFTIAHGGSYKVFGPDDSYVSDNNSLAVALIMLIPLIYYLTSQTSKKWVKRGLIFLAFLCAFSALGSQSRGALLSIGAMTAFLWFKNKRNPMLAVVILIAVPAMIHFMPASWTSRMETIETYDKDRSAMGRINAWHMAFNLATSRPIGGGFELAFQDTFAEYAPDPLMVVVAHSIYFEVLGEHGFVGLGLFLGIWIVGWRKASQIIVLARHGPEFDWAKGLASMIQTSLVGYLIGGAFLNLAYYDLPYYLLVVLIVTHEIVSKEIASRVKGGDPVSINSNNAWRGLRHVPAALARPELKRN
jgi:probable O-glycosylation ligase (exosortase A-associated)